MTADLVSSRSGSLKTRFGDLFFQLDVGIRSGLLQRYSPRYAESSTLASLAMYAANEFSLAIARILDVRKTAPQC